MTMTSESAIAQCELAIKRARKGNGLIAIEAGAFEEALSALRSPGEGEKPLAREIFDAGFRACRFFGDNHAHYQGEQADRVFETTMTRLNAEAFPLKANPPSLPAPAEQGEGELERLKKRVEELTGHLDWIGWGSEGAIARREEAASLRAENEQLKKERDDANIDRPDLLTELTAAETELVKLRKLAEAVKAFTQSGQSPMSLVSVLYDEMRAALAAIDAK